MVGITSEPIEPRAIEAKVESPEHGAILTFSGVARNHHQGKSVDHLYYEAYEPMALAEMGKIEAEILERWPAARVAMVHRTGTVAIGEPSVVICVGAAHRVEAYEASRYAIEELKARVPVWKRETYADGTAWIANRS
ncbi:molybdopterin synthase catalytic subunit [Deltaproteobacteria bacterium]|nr:molybdopterin synthase catalytic subunit [Deltaproteobacteria bacterium]